MASNASLRLPTTGILQTNTNPIYQNTGILGLDASPRYPSPRPNTSPSYPNTGILGPNASHTFPNGTPEPNRSPNYPNTAILGVNASPSYLTPATPSPRYPTSEMRFNPRFPTIGTSGCNANPRYPSFGSLGPRYLTTGTLVPNAGPIYPVGGESRIRHASGNVINKATSTTISNPEDESTPQ